MLEILVYTPIWVYGLFVILLYLGWQQAKTRAVKRTMIYVLPTAMICLSFMGVMSSFGMSSQTLGYWIMALLMATYIGVQYFPVTNASFNHHTQQFQVPGSWVPLILMMAIFFTKYLVGVAVALNPEFIELNPTIVICSLLYGGLSGVFASRAITIARASYD